MKLRKKLYPLRHGLTLGPWKKYTSKAYSHYGGRTGRSWSREWYLNGRKIGQAGWVCLNGDGIEVRSRSHSALTFPSRVECEWTNENGVSNSKWPHPKGFRWMIGCKTSSVEYIMTLEREMSRQRAKSDERLRKAIRKARWSGKPRRIA